MTRWAHASLQKHSTECEIVNIGMITLVKGSEAKADCEGDWQACPSVRRRKTSVRFSGLCVVIV